MRNLGILLLLLWTLPAYAQGIICGPWVQGATSTSAVIMWESSTITPGAVDYGTTAGLGLTQAPQVVTTVPARPGITDNQAIIQEAQITGLTAGTTYHYQVTSDGSSSAVRTFNTHSASTVFKFAANGHINALTSTKNNAAWSIITQYNPDFFILTGDIGALAANINYQQLMTKGADLVATKPFHTITGNHDVRTDSRYVNWFYNEFDNPVGDETFYTLQIRNIRFIFLRGSSIAETQIPEADFPKTWLTGILDAPTTADWTILVHDGNLYNDDNPALGFVSWFETLVNPYLGIIDAVISASGSTHGPMPNGLFAAGAFDDSVSLWEVDGTSMVVKRVQGTLGNVVFTTPLTTDPGGPVGEDPPSPCESTG